MIDRRMLLAGAGPAILTLAAPRALAAPAVGDVTVRESRQGAVRGQVLADSIRFLGIPFAAPPIGSRRFRLPEPPVRRKAILNAYDFAPAAVQKEPQPGLYGPGPLLRSEDCLYLNIWTPRTPGPHPVYVWVHGGGNVSGSSRMPVFDGSRFARRGIVCVTITYRVGPLGFLYLGRHLGADFAGSGNHGLMDIVAALGWVRDNIGYFGGDPKAVTVGGQSAGAKNVCALMAMPAAKGLFRAAIVESGGAQTAATADTAGELTDLFLRTAGIASNPRAILDMPGEQLVATQMRMDALWRRRYPFRAIIDGVHLPDAPLAALRRGVNADIPLLIGWTRDEVAFFGPNARRDGSVAQDGLTNMSLDAFQPVYRRYDALMPQRSPVDRRYAALTAEEYGIPTIRAARAHAAAGGKAWLWRLDMPRAAAPNQGYSVHGAELPLVWDKVDDPASSYLGPDGAPGRKLATLMHRHWVDFIRLGRIEPGASPWPAYGAADDRAGARPTMLFDAQSRVVDDPDGAERRLWDGARFDFEA